VLFTGLSGLFSDRAFAASDYDSTVQVADHLILTDQTGGSDTEDISTSYMGYITGTDASYSQCDSTCKEYINDVISSGSGWYISQYYNGTATFYFTSDTSARLDFHTVGGVSTRTALSITTSPSSYYCLNIQYYGGTNVEVYNSCSALADYDSATNTRYNRPFLATIPINYPSGYAGAEPPASLDDTRPVIKPEFTYQLSDKKLTATDHNQDLPTFTPDEGYNIVKYQVEWSTFKCGSYDESHGINAGSCQSPSLKDHQILDQASDYTYTVSDYAHYQLTAEYLVQECYRYPSYPATPDYCFDISLGTELPDYRFTSTSHDFDINGQSLSGDTSSETCDVSGFCQVTEEDCTIQPDVFSTMRCNFNNALNTGLLNPSLNAFKSLISSLVVPSTPTCGFSLSNVNIPGGGLFSFSSFGSSVCNRAAQIRSAFPIGLLVINFLLALLELKLVVDMVNKLLNDKDNDVIVGVNQ